VWGNFDPVDKGAVGAANLLPTTYRLGRSAGYAGANPAWLAQRPQINIGLGLFVGAANDEFFAISVAISWLLPGILRQFLLLADPLIHWCQ
jgi:hypothetical protein